MKVEFLEAEHGDCILISFSFEDEDRNILIDSGPSKTYEYSEGPRVQSGALKSKISYLKKQNQVIDLLILTHVDDDHIGGILKYFESNDFNKNIIKKIWFNSGQLINEYFKKNLENENIRKLKKFNSKITSISQGVSFEDIIKKYNLWDKKLIKSDMSAINYLGLTFTILSPNNKKLEKLLKKWKKESPSTLTSSMKTDYDKTFEELLSDDKFKEDKSVHNGSSIAFILEIEKKKILFLGDAHPKVIIESLLDLDYSEDEKEKLEVDFIKLSHHGSKANTSEELLKLINCKKFIISTNGQYHGLPNKVTFARIKNILGDCEFYFNYKSLINKIFSDEEQKLLKLKSTKDLEL